ncbi:MAG: outer membrane beta-barrel protein [Acidobacteriota bacterium]
MHRRNKLSDPGAPTPLASSPLRSTGRRIAGVGLALILLTAVSASAQRGSFELTAGAGSMSLDDKLGDDSGLALDLRVGYFVTDRVEIEIQRSSASSILEGSFDATTLNAVYHFESSRLIVPYVVGGVGLVYVEIDDQLFGPPLDDDGTALRAAIGGRIRLGDSQRASLRVELTALHEDTFDEDSTHLGLTTSFAWRFGGR